MMVIPPTRGDTAHGSQYSRERRFQNPDYLNRPEAGSEAVSTLEQPIAETGPTTEAFGQSEVDLGLEALERASEKAARDAIVLVGNSLRDARVYASTHDFKLAD